MTILFPGRYDRCHIGHIITIQRLAKLYDKVIVVILGYDGEQFSVQYRHQVLKECLEMCKGNYSLCINDKDWRNALQGVTIEECKRFGSNYNFDIYGTGNQKFLKVMEDAGYKVCYVERAYDYSATDDRAIQEIKRILDKG